MSLQVVIWLLFLGGGLCVGGIASLGVAEMVGVSPWFSLIGVAVGGAVGHYVARGLIYTLHRYP